MVFSFNVGQRVEPNFVTDDKNGRVIRFSDQFLAILSTISQGNYNYIFSKIEQNISLELLCNLTPYSVKFLNRTHYFFPLFLDRNCFYFSLIKHFLVIIKAEAYLLDRNTCLPYSLRSLWSFLAVVFRSRLLRRLVEPNSPFDISRRRRQRKAFNAKFYEIFQYFLSVICRFSLLFFSK